MFPYLAAALTEGAREYLELGGIAPDEEEALENLDEGGRDAPGDLNLLLLLAVEPALSSCILLTILTAAVWKCGDQGKQYQYRGHSTD